MIIVLIIVGWVALAIIAGLVLGRAISYMYDGDDNDENN